MPFIVLEGLDGAGKSTQVRRLTELLASKDREYEFIHFPRFDTPVYGDLIARFLRGELGELDDVSPYLVALIFAGDRAQAADMIKGWIDEGKYVILDRFVYSNIAFQCAKLDTEEERNALKEWILELEFEHNKLPRPDVSLFLDVPFMFTEDSLAKNRKGDDRSYLNGAKDIHEESLELQRKVRAIYLSCAEADDTLHVIDCSDGRGEMDSPDNIFRRIEGVIKPLIE